MAELSAPRESKPRVGGPDVPTADLFRLDGRTIVITGGGGSMGLSIAGSILESGGDVICLDQAPHPPLAEAWSRAESLAATHGTRLWYHSCAIDSTPASTGTLAGVFADAMARARHPLRGLVCCAGISGGGASESYPLSQAARILDVNVLGTLAVCQLAVREMRAQAVTGGSIVLFASMSAHGANRGVDTVAYNASKAAVVQIARSLAAEYGASSALAPAVRVNSISPGYTRTRMTEETLARGDIECVWTEGNMLLRLAEPDEMRGPAMFLLADASSYVTGADIRVDGGHTAW